MTCRSLVFAVGLAACAGATGLGAADPAAMITDHRIPEISGIVAAESHDGFWVHNDSGHGSVLYGIDRSGTVVATVTIDGVPAFDWEDLTAYRLNGVRHLVIGDFGDNFAVRAELQLLAIVEPTLAADAAAQQALTVEAAWIRRFRLPGGAADCEGLAWDPRDGRFLILSKREDPARLFALPATAAGDAALERPEQIAAIPAPPVAPELRARRGEYADHAHHTTGLACTASGDALLVTNYVHLLRYRRAAGESWAAALRRTPETIPVPMLAQTEAVCVDGDHAVIVSEQLPAPMIRRRLDTADDPQGRPPPTDQGL